MSERRVPDDLLLDSEASLRIADRIVRELGDTDPMDIDDPASAAALTGVLLRTYTEIVSIVESLRRNRTMLDQSATHRPQFQDITAQQLGSASTVLENIEERLASLARLIDRSLPDARTREPGTPLDDARPRQAVAHEIFVKAG